MRAYIMQNHINLQNSSTKTIKAWIMGLLKMKRKDQKLKLNSIYLYLQLEEM